MNILIDDDELIQIGWKLKAMKCSIHLECYTSIEQFFDQAEGIPKDSIIYIDSELGNNVKGEIASELIFRSGFSNIVLTTGHPSDHFDLNKYFWITRIISKSPPFIPNSV